MKKVLTIAGSDCSGGAGIQADLKTIGAFGCYGMSVITAVTVQNTCGVKAVYPVEAEVVRQQFEAVCEDIFPDAVKIGMLCNEEIIEAVAQTIEAIRKMPVAQPKIVLDPVLVSTSGRALLQPQAKEALQTRLLPFVDLVTPNLDETKVLCDTGKMELPDREAAGRKLAEENACAVLIKGGHGREYGDSDAQDLLIPGADKPAVWFRAPFIENPYTHGTGCTLSSAIACGLAEGNTMEQSVQKAKEYLTGAIAAGLDLGAGNGPLDHFYKYERMEKNGN
ncbi:MAG TPA: bifunctional hydroxymethylpyrimidine kinase/phosphomethylpyrimidine kinase [Lachnospiraceae bacterium]|nr:bifunctional hydroxymethylpyrimidine kinase/phosphomethylpyrimidine kinase [Lachnospiraceae bacterium]